MTKKGCILAEREREQKGETDGGRDRRREEGRRNCKKAVNE